jgi:hypothetical protein
MNERLNELADEAVNSIPDHVDFDIPDVFKQKFADMIVKECGVALSPMLRDMVSRGQAYDLIKQHFGVER